jgi:hypothetical protein
VLLHDAEGVDCYHGALIPCAAEDGARGVDGVGDLGGAVLAFVDELVADGDGVEGGPVTVTVPCGVADVVQAVGEVLEVEDPGEDF